MSIIIQNKKMVSFWLRLVHCSQNKLSSIFCKLIFSLERNKSFTWLHKIESIFNNIGLCNIWNSQGYGFNHEWILKTVEQKLKDQYVQSWYSQVEMSSKAMTYRIIKTEFCFEEYLSLLPENFRILLAKFRTCNHRLPIETGRWHNIEVKEIVYFALTDLGMNFIFYLNVQNLMFYAVNIFQRNTGKIQILLYTSMH